MSEIHDMMVLKREDEIGNPPGSLSYIRFSLIEDEP